MATYEITLDDEIWQGLLSDDDEGSDQGSIESDSGVTTGESAPGQTL